MASAPLVTQPLEPLSAPAGAEIAIVAADQFASRRIATALAEAGLAPTTVADETVELIELAPLPRPDIILLAVDPSSATSLADVRRLTAAFRGVHVVIVSTGGDGAGVRQVLGAGAAGVVNEAELEVTLVATTQAVLVGNICVPRKLHRCLFKPAFSHRERQVLALVVRGFGNRQIAARLFLAESTVKSHLASAFQKLGVRSRKEAAALLMDPDEGLGASVIGVEVDPPVFANGAGAHAR
jgi:DNA-binding NarL/FixJ family response regulator